MLFDSNNRQDRQYVKAMEYYESGSEKNLQKALDLFIKASKTGHLPSIYKAGIMYLKGEGTDKDPQEAFRYFQLLKDKDYVPGHCALGYCYQNGLGTKKDLVASLFHYEKAADNSDAYCAMKAG